MSPEHKRKGRGRPRRSSAISLTGCPELDRETDLPLYYELATLLTEVLELQRPKPGATFPTEAELERRFSVSRPVVREALKILMADGAIYRVQGLGTFIAPARRELRPQGLIGVLVGGNGRLAVKILKLDTQTPRATVARRLGLKRTSKVISVIALVYLDDHPLALIESHSVPVLASFVLAAAHHLHGEGDSTPRPAPPKLTKASLHIEQTCLGPWGGPKLDSTPGDPALLAHLVQFGQAGRSDKERPLEYADLIYPSSVQLVTELS